jgi:hypothetical protein
VVFPGHPAGLLRGDFPQGEAPMHMHDGFRWVKIKVYIVLRMPPVSGAKGMRRASGLPSYGMGSALVIGAAPVGGGHRDNTHHTGDQLPGPWVCGERMFHRAHFNPAKAHKTDTP